MPTSRSAILIPLCAAVALAVYLVFHLQQLELSFRWLLRIQ
jgi:hypothetical protein